MSLSASESPRPPHERHLQAVPDEPRRLPLYDIIREPSLPPAKKVVLLAVVCRFGGDGRCWAAVDTLWADSGIDRRRTVQNILTDLVKTEWLCRSFNGRAMIYTAGPRLRTS